MQRPKTITSPRLLLYSLLVTLVLLSSSSWAALTAIADRQVLDSNETLQLTVRFNGQALTSEPDFSVLERDFRILSNNRQQQYSMINGRTESFTDWKLTLTPKRIGRLLIPSIRFKQDISDAIEISVRKASPSNATGQPVYTETLVDKSSVYVQEQLLLTHRLFTSIQLTDLSMDQPEVTGAVVQQVDQNQFRKRIGNRDYIVVEKKYALFPQASGKLEIPTTTISAYQVGSNQNSFFRSRGNQLIRNTEAKTIDVLARPGTIAADQWMPSSQLQLTEQWSNDLDQLVAGEPVTRTITIRARGLTGAQIQPLVIQPSDSIKVYPDRAQLDEQTDAGGVTGIRQESLALVPNRAGEIVLPAISVQWWDTVNRRLQTATLDAVRLQVAASGEASAQNAIPGLTTNPELLSPVDMANSQDGINFQKQREQSDNPSLLLTLSLATNALLLALVAALLMGRSRVSGKRKPASIEDPVNSPRLRLKQQLKAIEMAAAGGDLTALRQAIINWGGTAFPECKVTTLETIVRLCETSPGSMIQAEVLEQLRQQFRLLDQCLYNQAGTQEPGKADLKRLIGLLKKLDISHVSVNQKGKYKGNDLKPLYPTKNFG